MNKSFIPKNQKGSTRTQREAAVYEKGLSRDLWRYLGHCEHYWKKQRKNLIKKRLRKIRNGVFLELGSQTWADWLQNVDKNILSKLYCINISENEIEKGKQIAISNNVYPEFLVMDAHKLEFENESIDVVFGSGILHHLDIEKAIREINRVIKKDGIIVFNEPLIHNPISKIIRFLTPNARTDDEKPLMVADLKAFENNYMVEYFFEQLLNVPFGICSRIIFENKENFINKTGFLFDKALSKIFPPINFLYRSVTLIGEKTTKDA